MVVCGVCGNNTCNAGTGRTVKGIDCDCEDAYEMFNMDNPPNEKDTKEKIRKEEKLA